MVATACQQSEIPTQVPVKRPKAILGVIHSLSANLAQIIG